MLRALSSNVVLWILPAFLALFFALASGAPKLLLPIETLAMPLPLPELFIRCIGVCEVLGALGLILPSITRVKPGLTPLATLSLTALTLCAATYQMLAQQPANAVFALAMGAIAAFVAYGRWRLAPIAARKQATSTPALTSEPYAATVTA
jgi:putative oxidoreductase